MADQRAKEGPDGGLKVNKKISIVNKGLKLKKSKCAIFVTHSFSHF